MPNDYAREAAILEGIAGPVVTAILRDYGAYMAGGAVTSVFSSFPIRDFDIFFRTPADLDRFKADHGVSEGAIVTDAALSEIIDKHRVQFVAAVTGEPGEVIAKFDFTICQAAYDPTGDRGFVFGDDFFRHLAQRRLVFNTTAEYPICSLYRARKFISRGFHFAGIEAIKLGLTIQNLEIETYADLRRQLMGIDTLFLQDLTDSLASKSEVRFDLSDFLGMLDAYLAKLDVLTGAEDGEQ